MTFSDPPYNVNYEGGMGTHAKNKREGIMNDNMSPEEFHSFLEESMKNMLVHCKGVFYICMSSSELGNLRSAFESVGGHWQSYLIWVKNTFTLSRADWQNQYEPILYGWNGENTDHYFAGFRDEGNVWENLEKLKPKFEDGKTVLKLGEYHLELEGEVKGKVCRKKDCVDIWYEKKATKNPEHPTQKPVLLVAKAIRASSVENDVILDPFAGSGTTMIAAEQLGRRAFLMELDPKFCDVIVDRYEKLTGKKAEKV